MKKRGRNRQFHLFYLVFFFSTVLSAKAQAAGGGGGADRKIQFDVGVILDTDSWIGNISLSCMRMAVDDFYAVNSGYSTRISLHVRDAGGDAFGAASAGKSVVYSVSGFLYGILSACVSLFVRSSILVREKLLKKNRKIYS